ncbi:MAG: SIS domain-containing protein [Candidatus Palauibacterales bacterium]|nr:SIS domain-containing protein [Candidatus Palauibacterales bacterium]MDP2530106.1 SIS domain-containing protein [Candidatus Palauibacterales bacterium]MDP2582583.1 SIS domain-containing protein [Candidatus Palauibacterales bacterium]
MTGPGSFASRMAGLAAAAEAAGALGPSVDRYVERVLVTLRRGGKLLLCGNGGSAATAEHVAAEYVVRFRRERRAFAAVALTSGGAVLTAASNDLGYAEALARTVRALARPEDLLILHSTSGDSPNLLRAAEEAKAMGVATVGVLARGGGRLASRVDLALVLPARETALAQELQLALEHAVVDRVEAVLAGEDGADAGAPGGAAHAPGTAAHVPGTGDHTEPREA